MMSFATNTYGNLSIEFYLTWAGRYNSQTLGDCHRLTWYKGLL
ncbi:hypothetical protein FVEG_05107 [Fusarium verticillioides 7600]|uniref:Uncharacterized protein n=1 Tax=Gibberella moniliformis (strain M3125 / FGSC 7600) TaxID=334819 RepID=W7M864_GIBM7|nr:hypothetical protein FVEG_05107 [Fusarium verticillioides 7600]EWG43770.1 hypothetical protein FVEG_05107 [Fusarium verticillioides 7600]